MFFRKKTGISWLVVFLGNPGAKYAETRHNAGFMCGDLLAKRYGAQINRLKYKALTCRCDIAGQSVLLMKPQTFMNLSGDSVAPAASFFKIPPERVLVISDDVALPLGKLRIRKSGSAGGHNGLKSIIARLGTENFPRIKIGVDSPPHPNYDMADWVLSTFKNKDAEIFADTISSAADCVEAVLKDGFDAAMSKYN